MQSTRFTELVGCKVPIQLSPMGSVSTPELAKAVTSAGAHALLGLTGMPLPVVEDLLARVEEIEVGPYGVNFVISFLDGDAPALDRDVVAFAASRAPLVDFYLGPPDRELIDVAHAGGALVAWQVTSLSEAIEAEAAGCDLIIAHGVEAGGRNPGGIGLIPLLAQVLDAVSIPVVAAGGISTGRGVAAALAMGADGVRVGTRFLAAVESGAHPEWVDAVLAAEAEEAIHTDVFNLMFPPHLSGARVLRASAETATAVTDEFVAELVLGDEQVRIPRLAPHPATKAMTGNISAMAMYAGQGVGAIRRVQPAAEIVTELIEGATAALESVTRLLENPSAPSKV